MPKHELQLSTIVRATPWLVSVLEALRDVGPFDAYVGAGAVRDTVWNWLTDRPAAEPAGDVDVLYFDPTSSADSAPYEAALTRRLGSVRWEVTNQAWIHKWRNDGCESRPHRSVAEAVATWPETATAVAIRLRADEGLEVVAPFGLDDLFELTVRHNPARVTSTVYNDRIQAKNWAGRWPGLRIMPADATA
jgi:hypothetical protein